MSAPRARRALDTVPLYRAGRPAGSDDLKLSSNENPHPPLPGVLEQIASSLARINRYPDAGMSRLYEALARTHDLPEERFAAGNGSVSVLFSLLSAYCGPGDEVVHAWRSFEAYPIAVDLTGATGIRVPLRADHTHDLDAMATAVTERTKAVLVCTPNNPTGPAVSHADLVRFVTAVPSDVLVVVDEAYAEFVRTPGAADAMALQRAGHDNVVVLRTFSKAYGLAGLRVGYALGHPDVAEAVRKATAPFSVTDVAQTAAVASLEAADELAERVAVIVDQRIEVMQTLRAQGWAIPDSDANFVWLPAADDTLDLAAALEPLAVRPFPGEGIRVSIGSPDANLRFLDLAARWVAGR